MKKRTKEQTVERIKAWHRRNGYELKALSADRAKWVKREVARPANAQEVAQ